MGASQSRYSSVVQPSSSGTSVAAAASSGSPGSVAWSATRPNAGPATSGLERRSTAPWAASRSGRAVAAKASAVAGTFRREAIRRTMARTFSRGSTSGAPLCSAACAKSPAARGAPSRAPTLMAPADSPKTVTRAGSPPKASMFSRTQVRAAIWSSRPRLAGASGNRP